jgi:hypothetical protein
MGTDSQYDTLGELQAASPPATLKRVSVNLARDLRNFKRTTAGSARAEHVQTADNAWWEQVDQVLTPEMFYKASHGSNWAPAMQDAANVAENINASMIYLRPGFEYTMDDQVLFKPGVVVWGYGAKLLMRSNPSNRGGFIKTMGDADTNSSFTQRDDMALMGVWAEIAPGIKGVNCFGTTVSSRISFVDCTAKGATWGDENGPAPKQGGRGFSCHSRTNMIKHVNCKAIDCSIGAHILDKADYDSAATPVLAVSVVTNANPAVLTITNHGLQTGQQYQAQRFSGDGWSNLNGNTFTVTRISSNQFSLNFSSASYPTFSGGGRLSKADTGYVRDSGITYLGMEIENCNINGLIFEQVLDSQNTTEPKNIYFQGRFKNCATRYPTHHGIITLAGIPGITIDAQVYNDSTHPTGSIIRGAGAQADIRIRGYVHTAAHYIDHSPATDGNNNLEVGSTLHPEGTSRNSKYELRIEGNTVSGDIIYSTNTQIGETHNQNYTWRSSYDIEHSASTLGGVAIADVAKHNSNSYRIKNMNTGDVTLVGKYNFESNAGGFYEEGTWTPILRGSSVAGSNNYSYQVGTWKRIGDTYQLEGRLTISGAVDPTMAGSMEIAGLPAAVVSGIQGREATICFNYVNNLSLATGKSISGRGLVGTNTIVLAERGNVGDTNLTSPTKFGASLDLRFRIIYTRA